MATGQIALLFVFLVSMPAVENADNEFIPTIVAKPSHEMIFPRNGIPIVQPFELLEFRQTVTGIDSAIETNALEFYIQSTNYPSDIAPGSQYRWEIRRNSSAVCRLRIQFDSFDVDLSSMCGGDVMIITSNGLNNAICGLKTGQILYVNFPSDQEKINITFTDDGLGKSNPSLQLLVRQDFEDCSENGTTKARQFFIESKDFKTSSTHSPDLNMFWTIARNSSSVCQLDFQFDTFQLQAPTNGVCANDYLKYTDNQVEIKQCGSMPANTKRSVRWPSTESTFSIEFLSDATVNARGFSVLITQVPNTC